MLILYVSHYELYTTSINVYGDWTDPDKINHFIKCLYLMTKLSFLALHIPNWSAEISTLIDRTKSKTLFGSWNDDHHSKL